MGLTVVREGGTVIVAVTGEIDVATTADLREALAAQLAADPDVLIIDLDGVGFFTSIGLAALALTQRAAHERGIDLRVIATRRTTLRPMQITGMADDLSLYASRADALADRSVRSGSGARTDPAR